MDKYIFTTKSQNRWGGGGGGAILSVQQKEGEHRKLLIKTEKDGEVVSKTVKFWDTYDGNFESIETIL